MAEAAFGAAAETTAAAVATTWRGTTAGADADFVSVEPISDAVALAKTANGSLTATKVATSAAPAKAAVFNKREPVFLGRANLDA